jgi:branched-chain amino acid transport system substrate-binding protein
MPTDGADDRERRERVNRRQAIRYLGGGALALGLAGCVQQTEDGGDGSSGGGGGGGATATTTASGTPTSADIGTVTFGVLVPASGPAAPLGKAQRRGAKLGVAYVNESNEFDFTVEAVHEDTKTDPPTGRERVEKVVEEDGVSYVAGALESSVALAVNDYVRDQDVVYTSGAATMDLTGKDCNSNTFRNETNAAQQMAGLTDFAAEQLGSKWWLHTTDDAYGNSAFEQIKRRVDAQGLDVEIIGETMPDKGTKNYSPQISKISNSGAEVVALPETGADLINFVKQATNAGLKDEVEIIGTALFAQVSRKALGEAAVDTHSSTLYNHTLETGDNPQFVEAYRDEYGGPPGSFARVGYELVRTAARGIREAGTADPTQVRETLEGLDVTTVLGTTPYRACDHQSVNPVWTGRIVEGENFPGMELMKKVPGRQAIRPCSETGCEM